MPRDLDKILDELEVADREVDRAKTAYDEATAKRAALMVEAAETGASRGVIAGRIGKSVTRVQQIIKRGRDED